jgi:hypothetical protein
MPDDAQSQQQEQTQQDTSSDSSSSAIEYGLSSGGPARLVHPSPVIHVRMMIDPAEASSFDDTFTLKSSDGSYEKQLTVADDIVPGDAFVDLIFDNLKSNLNYTLEVNPGAEGDAYKVFEDVPFKEIMEHYSILEEGDEYEPPEEEEDIGDAGPESVDWDDEEESGEEWGGDPEDLEDEFDNWVEDEAEEFGEDDDWTS